MSTTVDLIPLLTGLLAVAVGRTGRRRRARRAALDSRVPGAAFPACVRRVQVPAPVRVAGQDGTGRCFADGACPFGLGEHAATGLSLALVLSTASGS